MHVHELMVTNKAEGFKFEFLHTLVCCWNVHHSIINSASEGEKYKDRMNFHL